MASTPRTTVASLAARFDAHVAAQADVNRATLGALEALTRSVDALSARMSPEIAEPKAAAKRVTRKAPAKAAPAKAKAPRAKTAPAKAADPFVAVVHQRAANRTPNRELAATLRGLGLPRSGAVWEAAKAGATLDELFAIAGA